MSSTAQVKLFEVPSEVNFVVRGQGKPVILIHGLAASLHDWVFLMPELVGAGYTGYALDLLGHGDSPKPNLRVYRMEWIFDHFSAWMDSLQLDVPCVLVSHSLGAYLALEYAYHYPQRVKGLVLADPFYARSQLPAFLRMIYRHPAIPAFAIRRTPSWLLRGVIDLSGLSITHAGGVYGLPEAVRAQTASDYVRTAPGIYNVLNADLDLSSLLPSIQAPTLVLWGEQDQTLRLASFRKLVHLLPNAKGEHVRAGHVIHQSKADWFNDHVLEFLHSL